MSNEPADAALRGQSRFLSEPGAVNTAETSLCATCRQPLVQSGRETMCVRCVAGFLVVPDGLDGGVAARRHYGHFELLMGEDGLPLELGRGAMGTTYRARDTALNRPVALKVIEQSVAEHPAARERFLREARAAAKFQHPNVAAVSHYGEQEGECFYAMELVEGETLEARVRREGPLPVVLTLAIAIQVTKALVAAEARGIIHRDLKPTNLMLAAPEGETESVPLVKVIDFGLAKAVTVAADEEGTFRTAGGFVGTPAFASPEQFAGSQGTPIDHRSDIYSLGVTMWYALCGRTPFVGRTLEEIHSRQVDAPLPVEQLVAARVPGPVVSLLRSMLATDPAARPQSARALLDGLHRSQELSAQASSKRRRVLRRLIVAAALCLPILGGLWWTHRRENLKPEDRSIAVLPFESLSPKPDDAFYATVAQDQITTGLGRIAAVKVISPESANKYPTGKRDPLRIGSELGVRHLLEGTVRRDGARMDVTVSLIDTHDPKHPWAKHYERSLTDAFLLQGEITRAILDRLQASLSPAEKSAIDVPPTNDLIAYDLYLRAVGDLVYSAGKADFIQMNNHALALLKQSLERDPKFTLAYCAVAGVEDELFFQHKDSTPEELAVDHRSLAEAALHAAQRIDPDAGEIHLAMANHLCLVVHDDAQAKVEIDLARRTLPNNPLLETLAGGIAARAGRWEDQVQALERAAELDPGEAGYLLQLQQAYRAPRRYDQANATLSRLLTVYPSKHTLPQQIDQGVMMIEGRADLAPLRVALASAPSGSGPAEINVFRFLLAYLDRDADELARDLAVAPQQEYNMFGFVYPRTWFEGLEARLRGDEVGATKAFTSARADVEKAMRTYSGNTGAQMLSLLALMDAALGNNEEAVREGKRACELMPMSYSTARAPLVNCNLAIVYAWTGQTDLAIAQLEPWLKQPAGRNVIYQPSYGDLKLNPMWDPLRGNPRFDALVQRLAPSK